MLLSVENFILRYYSVVWVEDGGLLSSRRQSESDREGGKAREEGEKGERGRKIFNFMSNTK
jgi:hypothetical protein